jgi:hypothetical protein
MCVLSFAHYGRRLLDLYAVRGTFLLLWFVGSLIPMLYVHHAATSSLTGRRLPWRPKVHLRDGMRRGTELLMVVAHKVKATAAGGNARGEDYRGHHKLWIRKAASDG